MRHTTPPQTSFVETHAVRLYIAAQFVSFFCAVRHRMLVETGCSPVPHRAVGTECGKIHSVPMARCWGGILLFLPIYRP
ncbi:MAG: hypothetical protein LBC98_01150 [Prevotellaceae bacterium]|nr:hypothetical protein [Prevotellaceae bacterium]